MSRVSAWRVTVFRRVGASVLLLLVGTACSSSAPSSSPPSRSLPALASVSAGASPAPSFDPAGAATPGEAALAFERADENKNAAAECQVLSTAYLKAIRDSGLVPVASSCEQLINNVYEERGTGPFDPQDYHPSVKSVSVAGSSATVVIDFGIDPHSAATLADQVVKLVQTDGRWLVDAPDPSN